jgi:hypothetical protein
MIRLHPGGYLRADIPLPPLDAERRQLPVWTVTMCFKMMRMPTVPCVLLSVGRGSNGAVMLSHDGRLTIAGAHFGPDVNGDDDDERDDDEESDREADDDGLGGGNVDDIDDADAEALKSSVRGSRNASRAASRSGVVASMGASVRDLQASMLGASIDRMDSEQIELGDSVKAPQWDADGADDVDDDDDDDGDDKESKSGDGKLAGARTGGPSGSGGDDANAFKPATADELKTAMRVKEREWHVVSVSVDNLRGACSVFINGRRVVHLHVRVRCVTRSLPQASRWARCSCRRRRHCDPTAPT